MKAASVSNLDRAVACEMSTMATNKTGRIAVGTKETTPVVLAGFAAGGYKFSLLSAFATPSPENLRGRCYLDGLAHQTRQ